MGRRILGLAPALLLLLSPLATLAQPVVDPDRLNGTFDFFDDGEGLNNTLQFTIEGTEASATGQVSGLAGTDVVLITYTTIFPTDLKASGRNASIGQKTQVLIGLQVIPGMESETPEYNGFAAPNDCDAKARVRGSNAPSQSDAKLKCDLGNDLSRFDDPETTGPPSQVVVDVVDQAFDARKDVNLNVGGGKLVVKHKGSPAPG